ncbi:MAG: NCS2 family permease [Legionellales bacterium]|jgi:adenine/guanine/hypoxanthine permease|nr:NCS2 family permease [Legionellales bacterium]
MSIEKLFKLKQANTNLKSEILSGTISYLTVAYIAIINPLILSKAGIPANDVFIATCITIAISCLYIGIRTNLPIIIGPTSATNTYFLEGVTGNFGIPWPQGLTISFISGILIFVLSKYKIRKIINEAIPNNLTNSIIYGIGLFLCIISLKFSGVFGGNPEISHLTIDNTNLLIFCTTVIISLICKHYKIPGYTILGVIAATTIAIAIDNTHINTIISIPKPIQSSFFAITSENVFNYKNIAALFAVTIIVLSDSNSSLSLLMRSLHKNVNSNCSKPLESIAVATVLGSFLGTSNSGIYLESMSGINNGGKTGLTTCVTGLLFVLTLFLSPLLQLIPSAATSAVLFIISLSILQNYSFFKSLSLIEKIAACLIIITIPIRFSIADGIGIGVLSYTILNILNGKMKKISPTLYIINIIFICYFIIKWSI